MFDFHCFTMIITATIKNNNAGLSHKIIKYSRKIERTQERAPRFLLNDKISSYYLLLEKSNSTTLHVRRIKAIARACELFKSLNDLNPSFMKEMFKKKDIVHNLRDSHCLYQPISKKITYGKTYLLPNDLNKTQT